MKSRFIIFLLCIAVASCKKEAEVKHYFGASANELQSLKARFIMSSSYYRTMPGNKKGKPPGDTTIIVTPPPPPPPVYSGGYQIAMPPVLSQGVEGSCVAFASGYYTRSAEEYYKTNSTVYTASNILSPEYLFDQTAVNNCTGSTLLDALELMQNKGICTFQSMPYSDNNGCSLIPTAAQDAEALNYRITSYAIVSTSDSVLVKSLLNAKHPLVFSFNADTYFYNAGPGFIWKSFSGTIVGQHMVTICGYDDSRHAYKIINSWGTGWGDAGYSWIDYDFMPSVSSLALTLIL